jgi:putative sigma-54 modulation protein
MIPMKVNLQSVHFNARQDLQDFVQKKLDKLEVFYDRILEAEVILRVENASDKENKVAEVKLVIPGNDLVVKKQSASFEQAVDLVAEALERQLKKHKEKVKGF